MRETAVYEPLNADEQKLLEARRNQLLEKLRSLKDYQPENDRIPLFINAAILLGFNVLTLDDAAEYESFAIALGDGLIFLNRRTEAIQWSAQCQGDSRVIVLRGGKTGRVLSISDLAGRIPKESNLSYFEHRLDGFFNGKNEIDDSISTYEDFTCRCGHTCRRDSFRIGPVICDQCKLKWYTHAADLTGHFESEIDAPGTTEHVYGTFSQIRYHEGMTCCGKCGAVYTRTAEKCCPKLLLLAVKMLSARGENLEIPASPKALKFLTAHKERLREYWADLQSELEPDAYRLATQTLARAGLLSEIQ